MAVADKNFAGSIPAIYETYMVPMLFEPYAEDLTERVSVLDPKDVLEIAAGTGAVTRAVSARLGLEVKITATDLNQPMLDMAKERQGADERVTWTPADALALPFRDESFDAVLCQFGVMFFPDKAKAYGEARRVLRPGGSYIFNVWDKIEANDFVTVASQVLATRFPDDPPKFMERAPHGYHDVDAIVSVVKAAGFTSVTAEAVDKLSQAKSALHAATGYCQGNPLRAEIEARAPGELQAVTQLVASALEDRFGTGPIEGRIRAFVITALR